MLELTGDELEIAGQRLFETMGLRCLRPNKQVRLNELDPLGSYPPGHHLEIDYLIPYDDYCIVGEITGAKDKDNIKEHHENVIDRCNLIRKLIPNPQIWSRLGIMQSDLKYFRNVKSVVGLYIATGVEYLDVALPKVDNLITLYFSDYELLLDYANTMGIYALPHFSNCLGLPARDSQECLYINKSHLLIADTKRICGGSNGYASVFTFNINPYGVLPFAKVYRRDMLPRLNSGVPDEYQRPIIPHKVNQIRKLIIDTDFMFPSSILAVLSGSCSFDQDKQRLIIPKIYGSLSIIDGQHRLFAYADDSIKNKIEDCAQITVTAIQFDDPNETNIGKYSARTFIEINTTQTPVSTSHLDAIAYDILGDTSPRAIAAQVIIRANKTQNSSLTGLFDVSQSRLGIIQTSTILTSLKSIVNLKVIRGLDIGSSHKQQLHKKGYQNLLNIENMSQLETDDLLDKGVACFVKYFNVVKKVFPSDWPRRKPHENKSSLQYAKVIAGFTRLLADLLKEGSDWSMVWTQLNKIKDNIILMRKFGRNGGDEYFPQDIVFDPIDPRVPDSKCSVSDIYQFLKLNRDRPTSIQTESNTK